MKIPKNVGERSYLLDLDSSFDEIREAMCCVEMTIVVIVTSEYIMMCIINVYCCTHVRDFFPSLQDVIIVYGH